MGGMKINTRRFNGTVTGKPLHQVYIRASFYHVRERAMAEKVGMNTFIYTRFPGVGFEKLIYTSLTILWLIFPAVEHKYFRMIGFIIFTKK